MDSNDAIDLPAPPPTRESPCGIARRDRERPPEDPADDVDGAKRPPLARASQRREHTPERPFVIPGRPLAKRQGVPPMIAPVRRIVITTNLLVKMAKKPQGKRPKAPSPPVVVGRRRSSRVVGNAEVPAPRVARQPYRGRARVEPPAPKPAERRPPGRPRRVATPEAAPPVEAAPAEESRPNRLGRPRRGAEPAPVAAPVELEERRRSGRGRRAAGPVPQPVAAQVAEPVEDPPREEVAVQAALPVQVAPAAENRGRRRQRVVEEPVEHVELPGVAGVNQPPRDDELMIIDIVNPPEVIEIDGPPGVPRRDAVVQQRRNQERAWSESSDSDIEVIAHINRRRPRMVIELDHEEVDVPVAPMVVELEPINV
ncbi:hypothetical protein CRE_19415 [Caenorhabditis remanei]|uniref:Uncharacterized protein n=1 Tax=Caenorhabditis remanei TaxID=31234 RepID=E3N9Z3_CAERE|nr:hypothetical protein CRE_19415 [Caenorhabditis remanei]